MAFKDAWPAARAKYGDQVEVSLGHHKASRAAAVLDAVRTGSGGVFLSARHCGTAEPAGCLNRAGRGTVSDNGQEHSGQGGRLVRFLTGDVAG